METQRKEEMINFDNQLVDLDGNGLKDKIVDSDGNATLVAATLGRMAANALMTVTDQDRSMTGEIKVKRYDLALRVIKGQVSLRAEEIADIKNAIGKVYGPLIVGQSWKMLDPAES